MTDKNGRVVGGYEEARQIALDKMRAADAVIDTILGLLSVNETQGMEGGKGWREGVSPTAVCEELGLVRGWRQRPAREDIDFVWFIAESQRGALVCRIHGNTRRITMGGIGS